MQDKPADVFLLEEGPKIHDLVVTLVVLEDGDRAVEWEEVAETHDGKSLVIAVLGPQSVEAKRCRCPQVPV